MAKQVECTKLGKMAEGLERQTYPGELGERIFNSISQEAWNLWMAHQTILINENQLVMRKAEDRKFLEKEMEKFLFSGGAELPTEFTPENK